jgi:acyl dehydratase
MTCQSDDPVAQRVHRENAERMQLANYVAGLNGVPGKQVRYTSPVSLEEAIRIAVSVQEAERQENSIIASTRATTVERTATVKSRDTR